MKKMILVFLTLLGTQAHANTGIYCDIEASKIARVNLQTVAEKVGMSTAILNPETTKVVKQSKDGTKHYSIQGLAAVEKTNIGRRYDITLELTADCVLQSLKIVDLAPQ